MCCGAAIDCAICPRTSRHRPTSGLVDSIARRRRYDLGVTSTVKAVVFAHPLAAHKNNRRLGLDGFNRVRRKRRKKKEKHGSIGRYHIVRQCSCRYEQELAQQGYLQLFCQRVCVGELCSNHRVGKHSSTRGALCDPGSEFRPGREQEKRRANTRKGTEKSKEQKSPAPI